MRRKGQNLKSVEVLAAKIRNLPAVEWNNVTKLVLVYFFSTLYFYLPVNTLYLRSRGLSYVEINSLWGIIVGTMFFTEIPTGILADRMGHKRAIMAALGMQLLGEIIYIFANRYWIFVASSIVAGLGFAFSSGCIEALVYDELSARQREGEMSKAMGLIQAAQRAANLLAFSVGGFLIADMTQARFVLGIVATACAVAAGWGFTFTLRERQDIQRTVDTGHSLQLLQDGIHILRHNRDFRLLAMLAVATLPFSNYLEMYQTRLANAGLSPAWLGITRALAAGMSILGSRYAYRLESWLGSKHSLLLVTALPGILFLVAAVIHPALSVIAYCTLSGSMSLKDPIFSGHLNRHIERQNRATVLSLISMASGLYVALMGVLIGRIGDSSLTAAFVVYGGGGIGRGICVSSENYGLGKTV
ncbi:MAG: MFS transporter [Anaerolineae bacterium]|nr:MFS transporter [Anaerolineae bacterium]